MKREEKEIKDITLKQFRDKNMQQLQHSLDVLVKVRDMAADMNCPHCRKPIDLSTIGRDKNRIEATKAIARHLGGLQPERVSGEKDSSIPELDQPSPEGKKKIDELLSAIVPGRDRTQ
jgi:hypothetical protein